MLPKKVKWFLIVLIALVVVTAIALIVTDAVFTSRLDDQLARIADKGQPATMEQLAPADIPAARNGAIELRRAMLMLPSVRGEDLEAMAIEGAPEGAVEPIELTAEDDLWIDENLADRAADVARHAPEDARRIFDKLAPALAVAEQGLEKEGCRFDLAYDDGLGMLLPHLMGLRHLARLFALRGAVALRQGDVDAAIADVGRTMKLAQVIDGEPLLISRLVGIAIEQLGATLAQDIATEKALTAKQAGALSDIFESRVSDRRMVDALIGERVFGLDAHEMLRRGELSFDDIGQGGGKPVALLRPILGPFVKANAVVYLETMADIVDAAGKPIGRFRAAFDEDKLTESIPGWAILPRLLIPALTRAVEAEGRVQAILRSGASAFAIAAEVNRDRDVDPKKSAPGGLAMVDPFTGKPLTIIKKDGSIAVYSVGTNLKDDGGGPYEDPHAREGYPLAWHYPPAPDEAVADDLGFTVRVKEKEPSE